jgi:ribosomal protein L37E
MSKELRDRLHAVDPKLNIIPGYMHKRDWDASTGVICSKCGLESFRSRDGMCYRCWEQTHEYQVIDKTGCLEFLGDDILKDITVKRGKE